MDLSQYLALHHLSLLESGARSQIVDGTLLFADVSGFTALSERLQRRGREGGELMTNLLDSVFGRLIDVAMHLGGDLLTFGGDALLVLFDGPGHQERAVTAANEMQAAVPRRTPAHRAIGRVALAMSMGLASGPVALLACGTTERHLIVLGPTVDAVLAAEAEAGRNEISIAEPLDVASVAPSGGPLRAPSGQVVDPRKGLDGLLAAHLADPYRAPDHRRVTSVFIRFDDVGDVCDPAHAEGVHRRLDRLTESVCAVCHEHGMSLVTIDVAPGGGKFLLVSGAPSSFGDPIDRALDAVIDLRARCNDPVMIGVHHGMTFCGDIGGSERRVYAVIGDSVNVAARVMGKAPSGRTWCTEDAALMTRSGYLTEPVEPFAAKGKSELVRAVHLRGRVDSPSLDHELSTGTFGRSRELAQMRHAREALVDRPVVLRIVARPGMGKSALLDAFRNDLGPSPVLSVSGGRYTRLTPYRALAVALGAWMGVDPDDARAVLDAISAEVNVVDPNQRPWIPLLALTFGIEVESTAESASVDTRFIGSELRNRWAQLVAGRSGHPPVLIVDDAHWLDNETASFIAAVARRPRPSLVVISGREIPPALADLAGRELRLGPLGVDAARKLVRRAAPARLTPDRVDQIVRQSAGNPLYLISLARARSTEPLPATVEDALRSELDLVVSRSREALCFASVFGATAPLVDLAQLADLDPSDVAERLSTCTTFVRVETDIRSSHFVHPLRRDIVYHSMPLAARRRAHRRVAELIVSQPDPSPELLSVHYGESRNHREALRWSTVAAERAQRSGSAVAVAEHLERALASARHLRGLDPDRRLRLREDLGDAYEVIGRFEDAERALLTAFRGQVAERERARLATKLARLHRTSGNLAKAARWCEIAIGLATSLEAGELAFPLRERGAISFRNGDLAGALVAISEAAALADSAGNLALRAEALWSIGTIRELQGASGIRELREAVRISVKAGNRREAVFAQNNLGAAYYDRGRWELAARMYRACAAGAEALGDQLEAATASNNLAEILSDQGALDAALPLFQEALEVFDGANYRIGVGVALGNLGRLRRRAGEFDLAGSTLVSAQDVFESIGADDFVAETTLRRLELAVASRQVDLVADTAARVSKLIEDGAHGAPFLAAGHRALALVALWDGNDERLRAELTRSRRIASAGRLRYESTLTLEVALATATVHDERSRLRLDRWLQGLRIVDSGQAMLVADPATRPRPEAAPVPRVLPPVAPAHIAI